MTDFLMQHQALSIFTGILFLAVAALFCVVWGWDSKDRKAAHDRAIGRKAYSDAVEAGRILFEAAQKNRID